MAIFVKYYKGGRVLFAEGSNLQRADKPQVFGGNAL